MFRANRGGAGEFRRPRGRQREDARDDAGKHEYQPGYCENKRGSPMPTPHRHGAEKCTHGDRQGESQEDGGKYGGEGPNRADAVLNTRITGGPRRCSARYGRIIFDRNFGSLEKCVTKKVGEAGRRVHAT